MPSIGSTLDQHNGIGPGFDFLRIALALAVVLAHSYHTSYAVEGAGVLSQGVYGPFLAAILPMFFGLSGFLVMGSSLRTRNTGTFLVYRALRLVPALSVEVTLSALILGPLLTTVPLSYYFSDIRVLAYFGNIIGRVRYELPGVFEGLPQSGMVNANLWTLHAEFVCYFLMTAAMLTRLAYDRRVVTIIWIAMTVAMTGFNLWTGVYELKGGVVTGHVLVYSFATGAMAYHWRYEIPNSKWLALAAALIAFGLLKLPYTIFIAHLPLIYLMAWIGAKQLPSYGGDYSYGVYLYSYPIQQMMVSLSPSMREWWIVFPLSAALSLLVAAVSWTWIERPALGLKRYVHMLRPRPT